MDEDEFVFSSGLEKCIASPAHQCILCSEWVPSEWELSRFDLIQDYGRGWVCFFIRFGEMHCITCSPMHRLQWMGAVRMRVKQVRSNTRLWTRMSLFLHQVWRNPACILCSEWVPSEWELSRFDLIQDYGRGWVCFFIRFGEIHCITCSPMHPLQWMGAVRMRVKQVQSNTR